MIEKGNSEGGELLEEPWSENMCYAAKQTYMDMTSSQIFNE